ncbi:hypothetical protein T440DRAFT_433853 [Plenodomus tracheiphilus IPT5]|uniref:Uncharacterized protein n=1 Tax=Plenodomus tracheiphilus IPT5 TaxID=1408161 RepID=A0A6A7ARC3_9PLEO|nr:hypothetical protein T440DRAFT_433853 [Plenodomus tracheiphilus IPT5]
MQCRDTPNAHRHPAAVGGRTSGRLHGALPLMARVVVHSSVVIDKHSDADDAMSGTAELSSLTESSHQLTLCLT